MLSKVDVLDGAVMKKSGNKKEKIKQTKRRKKASRDSKTVVSRETSLKKSKKRRAIALAAP